MRKVYKVDGRTYTLKEMREIAHGAARAQMRKMGIEPSERTAQEALAALDDLWRENWYLVAAIWYAEASDNQEKLFRREWKRWAYNTQVENRVRRIIYE